MIVGLIDGIYIVIFLLFISEFFYNVLDYFIVYWKCDGYMGFGLESFKGFNSSGSRGSIM